MYTVMSWYQFNWNPCAKPKLTQKYAGSAGHE